MKRELLYGITALALSLSATEGWAERVRPTIPTTTLESGASYYLYNVEADLFMAHRDNYSRYVGINETPIATELTQAENGEWAMRFVGEDDYFTFNYQGVNIYSNYCSDVRSSSSWCSFVASGANAYTIQVSEQNSYYKADEYVGWEGGTSTYVKINCPTNGNIHWQLVPANESGDRYVAALKLYKALELNDGYFDSLTGYYETLYANRATSSIEEMTEAAVILRNALQRSSNYEAPYWNEYPILWSTPDGEFGDGETRTWALSGNSGLWRRFYSPGSSELTATVNVDELSTFVYSTRGSNYDYDSIQVYVDDQLVRTLVGAQFTTESAQGCRFFEVLEPGIHNIKWVVTTTNEKSSYDSFYIQDAGVVKSPLITVSLLEPGSLGTEVLYNTDHIKNVRRLKVMGTLNDDDFAKIKMMAGLLDLDLSETHFQEVPEKQFCVQSGNDTIMQFLHRLILPEGVEKIHQEAFYGSYIDTLALPSTLKSIEESAFAYSHIQEINMPDDCTTTGNETNHYGGYPVFAYMKWLKTLVCAKNWTMIPYECFYQCNYLENVTLPEKLEAIGVRAFYADRYMTVNFPEGLKRINEHAFEDCTDSQFGKFPESLELIGSHAFAYCQGLKNIELNVHQFDLADGLFYGCKNIETLRLNSPTVVTVPDNSIYHPYPINAGYLANIDLIVPSFQVNNYKLDKYWYNFKSITGFSTAEIQDWVINNPLVLNHDRFDGTPNITINGSYERMPSLKFNGTAAQEIANLTIGGSFARKDYSSDYTNYPGQIYSNGENISVTGDVTVTLFAKDRRWFFFSLPFDCKISDITFSAENVQYSIAYYDGASRAAVGATGSWKNYDKENDVIPAGTGFILQANKDTYCYFKAVNNAMKQNIVAFSEFTKTLDVNASEVASNTGWNLIGNPYQCYYNNHALNFTAPITVWDAYARTYLAYSLTDDDYAIRPNEAFFVQCPNEMYNTITFPLQGRQFSDIIDSQNAAPAFGAPVADRTLINLRLTAADESSDRTRIVLNEQASLSYETNCDASKFMSMDNSVSQLYTLGADGVQYAINERPVADGIVNLGIYTAKSGTYTISLDRCDVETVMLNDRETGDVINLMLGDYTFSAGAGNIHDRFTLEFDAENIAGIEKLADDAKTTESVIYNVNGQRANGSDQNGLYIIDGKKVMK